MCLFSNNIFVRKKIKNLTSNVELLNYAPYV